jgi:hypothetical protein
MKNALRLIGLVLIAIMMSQAIKAQHESCPLHDQHQQEKKHHAEVNDRGDHAMGFSHTKTTHHFRLTSEGGAIEVTANDAGDAASRDHIRQHLKHIAVMFSAGDFSMPMFIHGNQPPGVETMKRLKTGIRYQYEEMDRGAKVRISTNDKEAIEAVHDFLRFQIKDHQTEDSTEVQKTAISE